MPFSRYTRAPVLKLGEKFGTSRAIATIRAAVKDGSLPTRESVLTERQRLDHVAGHAYGDGRYWWIIAAASNIGWGLQVPPGTVLQIPELGDVAQLVG